MKTVAVLFARKDSIYKSFDFADVYDIERDARTFSGDLPVVAHPPCRAWASLRFHAKPRPDEKDLAFFSIDVIRKNGGVLEHPEKSTLFNVAGLPHVGKYDGHGGFTIVLDQNWFGHRARKRTRLYIVGCKIADLPPMPIRLGEATHTVGLWSGRNRATCRPSINKSEYEATPPSFAEWLLKVANMCKKGE